MTSIVKLHQIDGKSIIIDNEGNIIAEDIHNADEIMSGDKLIIRFFTQDNEYSFIDSSGLFFKKYSYLEYDIVSELIPPNCDIYKICKNGKYGIINTYEYDERVSHCIFDEIIFLQSNIFNDSDIVKLKREGKYSLMHGYGKYDSCKEYDFIYTPIQPLEKYIICQDGKFGFIDARTLEEIVVPKFDSIEELCVYYNCNVEKYTKDMYVTDREIDLQRISVPNLHYSYIIDANKIVSGEWGGNGELLMDYRSGEIYVHYLYYSPMSKELPINMYGYFYNLFDSRKYDVVIHTIGNYYLVSKDAKWGLIDDEFHLLLDICYDGIRMVSFSGLEATSLFVVTCQDGEFLYNPSTRMRTSLYESLSWYDKDHIIGRFKNYLLYKENGKYGILSPEGEIMIKAKFDLYEPSFGERDTIKRGCALFSETFNNKTYGFYIEDNKFYGKIPVEKYESCVRVGVRYAYYYVVKVGGKLGVLNSRCEEIELPKLDELIFAKDSMNTIFSMFNYGDRKIGAPISEGFVIGRINDKYNLYSVESLSNSKKTTLLISDCDKMEMVEDKKSFGYGHEYPYVFYSRNGIEGYVNEYGQIISPETFDVIEPISINGSTKKYYIIKKKGKVGLLDSRRNIVFPCIYDDVLTVKKTSAIIIESGVEKEVSYPSPKTSWYDDFSYSSEESRSFSRYSGSYAQDEMGYSDEDIDAIFDGDPSAYWNID